MPLTRVGSDPLQTLHRNAVGDGVQSCSYVRLSASSGSERIAITPEPETMVIGRTRHAKGILAAPIVTNVFFFAPLLAASSC